MTKTPKFSPEMEAAMVYVDVSGDKFRQSRIILREDVRKKAAGAADAAVYAMAEAANAFGLISRALTAGYFDKSEAGIAAICALCERALRLQFERDADTIESLVYGLTEGVEAIEPLDYGKEGGK